MPQMIEQCFDVGGHGVSVNLDSFILLVVVGSGLKMNGAGIEIDMNVLMPELEFQLVDRVTCDQVNILSIRNPNSEHLRCCQG